MGKQLAKQLRPQLQAVVKRLDSALNGEYTPDAESSAKRTLKNKALQILAATGEKEILENILKRSREATNMTDQAAAVSALIDAPGKLSTLVICFSRVCDTFWKPVIQGLNS